MANPQTTNGYTRIANEILEALARIRIPGEARQILDTILRKTYGFNKRRDRITLGQFQDATGIQDKSNLHRNIKRLLGMWIVTRTGQDEYALQKDHEAWKPLSKLTTPPPAKKQPQGERTIVKIDNGGPTAESVKIDNAPLSNLTTAHEQTPLSKLTTDKRHLYKDKQIQKTTPPIPPPPPPEPAQDKAQAKADKAKALKDQATGILAHLNQATKHHYQENDTNLGFIIARLKEKGVTPEVCLAIIDHKTFQWLTKPLREGARRDELTHAIYLRPATLFNKNKFWQYHGQVQEWLERRAEKKQIEARAKEGATWDSGPADEIEAQMNTPEQRAKTKAFLESLKRRGAISGKIMPEDTDDKKK